MKKLIERRVVNYDEKLEEIITATGIWMAQMLAIKENTILRITAITENIMLTAVYHLANCAVADWKFDNTTASLVAPMSMGSLTGYSTWIDMIDSTSIEIKITKVLPKSFNL